jgi:hypothetical protein
MRREVSSSPGFESLESKHYINEVGDRMLEDGDRFLKTRVHIQLLQQHILTAFISSVAGILKICKKFYDTVDPCFRPGLGSWRCRHK